MKILPFTIKELVSCIAQIKETDVEDNLLKKDKKHYYRFIANATHFRFGFYEIYKGKCFHGKGIPKEPKMEWYIDYPEIKSNYNFKYMKFEKYDSQSPDIEFAIDIFTGLEKIKELLALENREHNLGK